MQTLSELLNNLNVSDIKELLDYFPGASKVGRKELLLAPILQSMAGAGLHAVWEQLDDCQRLAVGEAVHGGHDGHSVFHAARFAAKYGQQPAFRRSRDGERRYGSHGVMTVLCLFLQWDGAHYVIPTDLQNRLATFVPKPAANALASAAVLPEPAADEAMPMPMTVRSTAPDALHDVVALLRASDQGLIAVSDKTRLPGIAGVRVVEGKIAGGDFYDIAAPKNAWEQSIGPIKALAWPLLLQAGALAQLNGSKLGLTAAGMKALQLAPADVARGIWRKWLTSTLLDEFSRVDAIKGQKGKARMNAVGPRRAIVAHFLQRCPVDSRVSVSDLSRFMQAEGCPLTICHDVGNLYISDPNYGSLGYGGVAYLEPVAAALPAVCAFRGVRHAGHDRCRVCVAARGAPRLGRPVGYRRHDVPVALRRPDVFSAECAGPRPRKSHRGDRARPRRGAAGSVPARTRQPAAAGSSGRLSAQLQQARHGTAMKVLATSLLIECVDQETADLIAAHKDTARLCMRAGARHLVVRLDQEDKFRKAAHLLGYGIPV